MSFMIVLLAGARVDAAPATIDAAQYLRMVAEAPNDRRRVTLLDRFSESLAANRNEVSGPTWSEYSGQLAQLYELSGESDKALRWQLEAASQFQMDEELWEDVLAYACEANRKDMIEPARRKVASIRKARGMPATFSSYGNSPEPEKILQDQFKIGRLHVVGYKLAQPNGGNEEYLFSVKFASDGWQNALKRSGGTAMVFNPWRILSGYELSREDKRYLLKFTDAQIISSENEDNNEPAPVVLSRFDVRPSFETVEALVKNDVEKNLKKWQDSLMAQTQASLQQGPSPSIAETQIVFPTRKQGEAAPPRKAEIIIQSVRDSANPAPVITVAFPPVDTETNHKLSDIINQMAEQIRQHWSPPNSFGAHLPAEVLFVYQPDGTICNMMTVRSSGDEKVDTSAERAVLDAGKFAPLPKPLDDGKEILIRFNGDFFSRRYSTNL